MMHLDGGLGGDQPQVTEEIQDNWFSLQCLSRTLRSSPTATGLLLLHVAQWALEIPTSGPLIPCLDYFALHLDLLFGKELYRGAAAEVLRALGVIGSVLDVDTLHHERH